MTQEEIQLLKVMGYGLAETDAKSDGASMNVEAAQTLGRLILEMASDNHRMADVVLLYRQMREDFRLLEERAEKVSKHCAELVQERDSLKSQNACLGSDVQQWKQTAVSYKAKADERDSIKADWKALAAERDSLAAELKAAVCARDHNRECVARLADEGRSFRDKYERALGLRDKVIEDMQELKAERDELLSVRESLRACRDSACKELESVKVERDGMKATLNLPLVRFAVDLERMNKRAAEQFAAAQSAGGVA